jgi:hypothetical protein
VSNDINSNNVGFGHSALQFPKNNFNTAIERSSQQSVSGGLSVGDENTSLGYNSLFGIENGSSNVCVGVNCGGALTSGDSNTFVGANSGGNQILGSKNTSVGCQNQFANNSQNSTVIGSLAESN